ncbi:hypothetical protein [Thioclava sp. GXIMD2076]|uniref:Flagellar biosynthesis protein FlgN n=1 Tax=Thioclava kandeliae TaxID=3070818 RepID=A0ABV1SLS0_9RHOB
MADKDDAVVEELINLLRLERDVIRKAEFEALTALVARKEALLMQVKDFPAQKLKRAHEMSRQNQRLLSAALKGIRAAQIRLSAIQKAAHSFGSYDKSGRPQRIVGTQGSIEKRA